MRGSHNVKYASTQDKIEKQHKAFNALWDALSDILEEPALLGCMKQELRDAGLAAIQQAREAISDI